jgi:hypothetical protein
MGSDGLTRPTMMGLVINAVQRRGVQLNAPTMRTLETNARQADPKRCFASFNATHHLRCGTPTSENAPAQAAGVRCMGMLGRKERHDQGGCGGESLSLPERLWEKLI